MYVSQGLFVCVPATCIRFIQSQPNVVRTLTSSQDRYWGGPRYLGPFCGISVSWQFHMVDSKPDMHHIRRSLCQLPVLTVSQSCTSVTCFIMGRQWSHHYHCYIQVPCTPWVSQNYQLGTKPFQAARDVETERHLEITWADRIGLIRFQVMSKDTDETCKGEKERERDHIWPWHTRIT